jgi:ATP-dependent DNA helicase RecG
MQETPDFVVIDEQQRFSVSQKAELTDARTNLLEATATPIPRTTALVTHGGLDVSILRESPVSKNVQTRIVAAGEARRLFEHTAKIIASGGQVAVVYPVVRDRKREHKSVAKAYERWSKEFPNKVGIVHGDLSEAEKSAAIAKLRSGKHQVGVVSSIIEIGLTLPLLKSMIIVNPEVYGVSTLHQFRGRLARKGGVGYYFLFTPDEVSPESYARLRLVVECSDGFELAERDAQMRGYGDLFEDSDRQHGKSNSTLFIGASLTPQDIHQFAIREGI